MSDAADTEKRGHASLGSDGRSSPLVQLLENVHLAAVALDPRGTVTFCNRYLAGLLGVSPAEAVGADWWERFTPADVRGELRAVFDEAVRRRAIPPRFENEILAAGSTRRTVRWTNTMLLDAEGNLTGTASLGEDVTERRASEQARRLAEAAIESSGTAMAMADVGGRVTYANPAFLRLWGIERQEEALGRNVLSFWVDPEAAAAAARAIVETGSWAGELVGHRADGREMTVRVSSSRFVDGDSGEARMIATFDDLTELHHARAKLERARHLAGLGYWSVDLASGHAAWEDETFRIFGVDRNRFRASQESFLTLVHPADRPAILAGFSRLVESSEPVRLDFRVPLPGGEERVLHSEAHLTRDSSGRPAEMLGVVMDVTARVRLEEQLRQAQKMEAVGALAGGIAHDFNNFLTVILSLTGLAVEALGPDHPAGADLKDVLATAERAAGLTRQILAFARRQPSAAVEADLGEVATGAGRMIERLIGEHIAVRLSLAPELPAVLLDPRLLEQVLLNLSVNARDAMPSGGTLRITTRAVPGDEPGRGRVELAVSDDGLGMDEATRQRAFDPFFTTKPPGRGTGLGLSVVHGIVTQCGGTVRLDSAPGRGTTVTLSFPACA
ncbi:MAG TPA: PAS domain S-box protein, partial [Anaeromyxobacteraceae bacterium]|nr:PAS domain S-box protein [Anaeromyxobacteraceae bacterium]